MAAELPEPDPSRDPAATFSSSAVVAGIGGPNPCCAKLWKKYQKLETSRTALREAVKLLQAENEKLQKENSELSKVCKEERLRGDSAVAARETESDARDLLEKEIIDLKVQNSTLQQTRNICKNDNELLRISELEEENGKLKMVLAEERKKVTSEKKKVEEEKSKSLEMQKILKSETQKSEEYRRVADTERKVANDWRASCERLRGEANEVGAQLVAQIQKTEEALKRAEAEKQKVGREKKRADSEKSLAAKNKTLVDVERKKVTEEKCRADSLFAKLEEQKKLNEHLRAKIQVERKNAIEGKKRTDHLFQKFEEERKQSEYLQRKSNELSASRDVIFSGKYGRQHVDRASESANVKLLKEKLKLKKDQLKHVKNVSKLDKAKNALIRNELQRLKQDWMQLLSRFNMLDDHLAGGVEGIHVLTELKQHPEIRGFEQKRLLNDSVPAPYFGLQAGMVPFGSSIPREYTSYQLPRESCTRPISGTSSDLGRHHRSSCPTYVSDDKFMGSQGKDSLFVSSSTDTRKKQNSVVPELPPKGSNDRALPLEPLKSPLSVGTEVTDKILSDDRKRKRTKKSLESAACLASKHDFLHLESNAHAATSNDVLAFEDDCSGLQQGNNIMLGVPEGDMENHRRQYLAVAHKAPPLRCLAKTPSSGGGNGCVGSKFASLLSFEEMIRGNCLNLLNLDNDVDEEKYRKAMERPLSPDLPIIRPHRTKVPTYAEPCRLGDKTLKDCPSSGFDAVDSETRSKMLEIKEPAIQKVTQNCIQLNPSSKRIECSDIVKQLNANDISNAAINDISNTAINVSCGTRLVDMLMNASLGCLLHEGEARNSVASSAEGLDNTSSRPEVSGSSYSGYPNSILNLQHLCKEVPNINSSHQLGDRSSDPGLQAIVGTSETVVTKPIVLDSNSMVGEYFGSKKAPVHLVGFTRMKRSNMVNIFQYWETLSSQARKHSKEASIDGPLLERVSTEPLLTIDEKVSLIFSLLLWDIRFIKEAFADGNFAASAFSLSVKCHMETRWTILTSDQLDVLISSIEGFLVNKEVVVCEKMEQKVSDASKYDNLDDESGIQLSTKPATIDQFISACILLASICVKVEKVDVVSEVSYKVLQMGKSHLYWTLLALHVFGSMCGDKFLVPKSCNFLMTAIRLVVLLLESKDTSLCLVSSYIQSNRPTTLPSCEHCLFDVDTVSIDGFISSLLEELDLCSVLWNNRASSNQTITRCSSHLGSSGLEINCGEPCNVFKLGKLTEDSQNCPAGINLCYFTELISLLELFGIYMSCEWTYNNVVVRLLEILELCTCEEYSAALFVLVSQLGRSFVDDVGYEQRAVNELRNNLSLLIGTSFTKSRSVIVQFSAIGALLSVLPLPFDKIVATQSTPLSGPFALQARHISEWFVQLSNEHQSLACSFFSWESRPK